MRRVRRVIVSSEHAVPWLRRSVAGISPRRPGFAPGLFRVEFVAEEVALGQVFLQALRVSPVSIIPPVLCTHISSAG
jgi:hypothetical protein